MVPDAELGLDRRDEVDDRLRLGLAGRAGAAVLRVAGLAERRPRVREVAVEVDEVGVGRAAAAAWPSGFIDSTSHRSTPARHRRRRQPLEDRHAVVLVAVDHADHEHHGAARRPPLDRGDRPALDRAADLDDLDGVGRRARRRPAAWSSSARRRGASTWSSSVVVVRGAASSVVGRGVAGASRSSAPTDVVGAVAAVVVAARRGRPPAPPTQRRPATEPSPDRTGATVGERHVRRRRGRARRCGCARARRRR